MGGAVGAIGAIASVAAAVGSSLLNKPKAPKQQKLPALAPVTVMPTPDDDAVRRARRRNLISQLAQSGRESTVLTSSDTLGSA